MLEKCILTKHLPNNHPSVLPADSSSGVPLIGELNKGVSLVDGAAHNFAIFGEDGLNICFGDQQSV